MGCAPSKQSVCRNCHAQCSPARRSSSATAASGRRSPPSHGDNHHVVALTSTTLGYLLLNSSENRIRPQPVRRNTPEKKIKDFEAGIDDSETWSKMIDKNIGPKTPIETPPSEPESINAPEKEMKDFGVGIGDSETWSKMIDEKGVKIDPKMPIETPPGEPESNNAPEKKITDFGVGILDSVTWSKTIDEKVVKIAPKTPIETPPGEPETINAWELMEGLEDTSPIRPLSVIDDPIRCFSFNVNSNPIPPNPNEPVFQTEENDWEIEQFRKPFWLQLPENQNPDSNSNTNETRIPSEFDPKSEESDREIERLCKPLWLKLPENQNPDSNSNLIESHFDPGSIRASRNSFEIIPPMDKYHSNQSIEEKIQKPPIETTKSRQPGKPEKLILYFTSLRGIRKTYEDCCYVRIVLKNSGFRVDERDVSMHSGFKDELKELLGGKYSGGGGLPVVFLGKKYIGGADEIRRFHDEYQLEKVLEGCELAAGGGGGGGCDACGNIKFFPCETCSGSCKIFYEVDSDGVENEDRENRETDYGFQRCPDCNENGLVRCPICCD